ncbi:MAG: hypothetical protein NWF07_07165, partial [Candidatus Bathyarchaeota archaeon]|nr:hypothetical protein [Candidatus Bathyarchaeota archaeon]
ADTFKGNLSWSYITDKPDPTITLGGDLSGSITLTDLAGGTLTATIADDSHAHIISNVDGLQAAIDAKLASSSYTAADVLSKLLTVDGSGSGIDADKLDGVDISSFVYGQNGSGSRTASATQDLTEIPMYRSGFWDVNGADWTPDTGWWWGTTLAHTSNGQAYLYGAQLAVRNGDPGGFYLRSLEGGSTPTTSAWSKIWNADNDGSGSGLDADTLDGQHSAYYLDWTNVTNKPDPTITLGGDLSGSITLTDLAGGTLTAAVVDDSHNHVTGNIDGLDSSISLLGKRSFIDEEGFAVPIDMAESWFKIHTGDGAPHIVYLEISSNYDNCQQIDHIVVTLAGYNQENKITSSTSRYNSSKLLEVKTNNPGGAETTEIWVRFAACTTAAGSFTVRSSYAIPTLVAATPIFEGTKIVSLTYNTTNRDDSSLLVTEGIRIDDNKVWHAGNDGSGSGLDADTLDGNHGSYYQPASTAVTTTTITNYSINPGFNNLIYFGAVDNSIQFDDSDTNASNEMNDGLTDYTGMYILHADSDYGAKSVLKTGAISVDRKVKINQWRIEQNTTTDTLDFIFA